MYISFKCKAFIKKSNSTLMFYRYLFQVMLEGGCLEWALIISIVLRDSSSVIRTINTASMTDTPLETVARMREGLSYLELWSDTEW